MFNSLLYKIQDVGKVRSIESNAAIFKKSFSLNIYFNIKFNLTADIFFKHLHVMEKIVSNIEQVIYIFYSLQIFTIHKTNM